MQLSIVLRIWALVALLILGGASGAVMAQDQAPDAGAAEGEVAPAEESAPDLPAPLTDPATPVEAFELRLIPLTASELEALAGEWQGIIRDKSQEIVDETLRAESLSGDAEAAALDRLTELRAERAEMFAKYGSVLTSWEAKGGDAATIAGFRAYRAAIAIEETAQADYKTLIRRAADWVTDPDGGIKLAIRVAVIVGAFLALLIVARIVRGFASRAVGRVPNLSKLLQSFIVFVIYWLTIAFGLMIVLSALGVNVTPLFALVGGASFIIAFAMQDTLGNLAAGLMIMINRPFDEGDYVDIGGVGGTVKSVSIVSTTVTTPDNQVIVVPNSKVWGNVITNVTASPTRRVDLVFGIGYDDSIETAQQVLEEVVAAHPLILKEPEPVIRVNELAASSVNFICRPWARSDDYWTVYWDLTRQVKERFDEAGISIPFPQTDMHIHVADSAPAAAAPVLGRPAASRAGGPDIAEGDEGHEPADEGRGS